MNSIKQFLFILNKEEKLNLFYLFILMIIGMFLETLSVGLVIPLINIILQLDNTSYLFFINSLPIISDNDQFQVSADDTLTIYMIALGGLIFVFGMKFIFLTYLYWKQFGFVFTLQRDISQKMYETYMSLDYSSYLKTNSSKFIKNVNYEVGSFSAVISQSIQFLIDLLTCIGIVALLLYYQPIGALTIFVSVGIPVYLFYSFTKKRLGIKGKEREFHEDQRIHYIQSGIGAVKDIRVLKREKGFFDLYYIHNSKQASAEHYRSFLASIPKQFLEFFSLIALVFLIFILFNQGTEPASMVAALSVFAAGAFRILPSLSRMMNGLQLIKFYKPSINIIYDESHKFGQRRLSSTDRKMKFQNNILIRNLSFSYQSQSVKTINDISFKINKGEIIGICGKSGSGKSTFINVFLGLLNSTDGKILVDDISIEDNMLEWQNMIGLVSQNIFLVNDSILANITIGIPKNEIDQVKLEKSLKLSSVNELIKTLPDQLETLVGERGIRLSGGQMQRIAIARALYNDPEIIIFDEATNALDGDSEKDILDSIRLLKGKKTIIMISHKIENFLDFDKIYMFENGSIVASGKYSELFNK